MASYISSEDHGAVAGTPGLEGPHLLDNSSRDLGPSGTTLDVVTFAINGVRVTFDIYLREDAPEGGDPRTTELGRKGRCVVKCRDGGRDEG